MVWRCGVYLFFFWHWQTHLRSVSPCSELHTRGLLVTVDGGVRHPGSIGHGGRRGSERAMDPLERAKHVLARAANACAAAAHILPARDTLARSVAAASTELFSLRASAHALSGELAAEEARGAAAAAAAAKARARLRQLAASAAELLAFAGVEAPCVGGAGGEPDARAVQEALDAWALRHLVARGVVERASSEGASVVK